MPKFTKAHYSFLEAIDPSNFLLITTNLFIKLWGSSSNNIWDILLTRGKCPNLQRAITLEIFFRIYSKEYQVISSLPVYSSSFKALASIVLRYFADKIASICFQRTITQEMGIILSRKKICVSNFFMRKPIKKFQNSNMHVSKVMLCIKKGCDWKDGWTNKCTRSNMPLQLPQMEIWSMVLAACSLAGKSATWGDFLVL